MILPLHDVHFYDRVVFNRHDDMNPMVFEPLSIYLSINAIEHDQI